MATTANQDIRHLTPIMCNEVKARTQNNLFAVSYDSFYEIGQVNTDGTDLSGLLQKGLAFDFVDNNLFIRLENDLSKESSYDKLRHFFIEEFKRMAPYFNGLTIQQAQSRMESSLNQIISLNPDDVILELDFDGTLFYKVWKNNYLFFYNHLIIDSEDENEDDVVLTIFNGDEKLPSYAGDLTGASIFLEEALI